MQTELFSPPAGELLELHGVARAAAAETIRRHHYMHSVPSAKCYYLRFEDALMVWSMPANPFLARSLKLPDARIWQLSRLWAPDGHERNLLTRALRAGVQFIRQREHPDLLISYADSTMGHSGGVYRAASWIYLGLSSTKAWQDAAGVVVPRRKFHSAGKKFLRKAEIEALGYREVVGIGKHRFVKPLSKKAKTVLGLC